MKRIRTCPILVSKLLLVDGLKRISKIRCHWLADSNPLRSDMISNVIVIVVDGFEPA